MGTANDKAVIKKEAERNRKAMDKAVWKSIDKKMAKYGFKKVSDK